MPSGFLDRHGCNIVACAQFGEPDSGRFFMRVIFDALDGGGPAAGDALATEVAPVAEPFGMTWAIHDTAVPPRVLILVSRFGHCLNDLLYRYRIGALAMDVRAIVSNHRDFYRLAGLETWPRTATANAAAPRGPADRSGLAPSTNGYVVDKFL